MLFFFLGNWFSIKSNTKESQGGCLEFPTKQHKLFEVEKPNQTQNRTPSHKIKQLHTPTEHWKRNLHSRLDLFYAIQEYSSYPSNHQGKPWYPQLYASTPNTSPYFYTRNSWNFFHASVIYSSWKCQFLHDAWNWFTTPSLYHPF